MQSLFASLVVGLFATQGTAMSAVLDANVSRLRSCAKSTSVQTSYGQDACPCVGIDNLKGYYATQLDFYHVQYKAETGSSCEAWDNGKHPDCRGSVPPQWCTQSWCYVDPCNCNIDVLPKQTKVGIQYQGSAAYWSYKTCGGTDLYTQDMSPDACILQKTESECSKSKNCGWDGKQCGGKEAIESCKNKGKLDAAVHGEEDCRCIGLGGRDTGKAFMYISEKDMLEYPADVGSKCHTWEGDSHPACKQEGDKPAFCSAKWCWVDPCKCSTAQPPRTVKGINKEMRFQGKTAYWSYATCGSADSWTKENSGEYCVTQTTEAECAKMEEGRCAWNGKKCLGKALVEICAKQQATGVIGYESPLLGGAQGHTLIAAFAVMMAAISAH